jgi:DNA invertase Pin-like site-specific DNA recombinase
MVRKWVRIMAKEYRAGIYLRIGNSPCGIDDSAIKNQRLCTLDYAKNNGIQVVKEYVDIGRNGLSLDRPGLQEMLRDIEDGTINCVIVKGICRLYRNVEDFHSLMRELLVERKARLCSVNDGYDSIRESDLEWLALSPKEYAEKYYYPLMNEKWRRKNG